MAFFSRGPAADLTLPYDPSSLEGLAARWVRWVADTGPLHNPVLDDTGEDAAVGQPDDVWFLAGTTGGDAERRCAVPAGRPLFFPAFNYWTFPAEEAPQAIDRAYGLLTVDAAPVTLDVVGTPVPFAVVGAMLNPVTGKRKPIPTVVWGLWKRLAPLSPGAHEVRFSGGDGYGFTLSVTYHLDVLS